MSEPSGFSAGFVARHAPAVAAKLAMLVADAFAPQDIRARAKGEGANACPGETPAPGPRSFRPEPVGPKHFTPADRAGEPPEETNETPAWDPRRADGAGYDDPIAAARAEGFAEGVAHARALAEQTQERDLALAAGIATAFSNPARIDREAFAERIRQTVMLLVGKIIGETPVAAERLADRIMAAATMLADAAEAAVLRVHPEDVPLIKPLLPPSLVPIADENVERGGFVLENASTIVEDSPDQWLAQLSSAIERVALP